MVIYRFTVSICGQTMVFGVLIINASTYIVKHFHEYILSTYYQIYQIQLIQLKLMENVFEIHKYLLVIFKISTHSKCSIKIIRYSINS